jgi:hypothetical protein
MEYLNVVNNFIGNEKEKETTVPNNKNFGNTTIFTGLNTLKTTDSKMTRKFDS